LQTNLTTRQNLDVDVKVRTVVINEKISYPDKER